MFRAYQTEQVREAEAKVVAAAPVDSFMKRAAEAVAQEVINEIAARGQIIAGSVVAGLVGGGDNGGDALYALSFLRQVGTECVALCLHPHPHERALAAARAAGVEVLIFEDGAERPEQVARECVSIARQAGAWIDGLLGSGAQGDLREPYAEVCRQLHQEKVASPDEPIVVAVDIPTGMWSQDGALTGPYLPADVTVTMGAPKPQLLLPPAAWEVGRIEVVDLGLNLSEPCAVRRLYAPDVADLYPLPGRSDHKYTRGVVQIVAGSNTFPMTGIMCAEGAARAGAGMVRFWGPDEAALAVLSRLPEAVAQQGRFQALLTGPGIDSADRPRVELAVSVARSARQSGLPQVLDAGALDYFESVSNYRRKDSPAYLMVLTPHAGEAAELLNRLDSKVSVTREEVVTAPYKWASRLHELTGATVVLKGSSTVVVGADGNCFCQAEAPAWAGTAGSGDVLAGVIASILATFQADLEVSLAEAAADSTGRSGYSSGDAAGTGAKGGSGGEAVGGAAAARRPGNSRSDATGTDAGRSAGEASATSGQRRRRESRPTLSAAQVASAAALGVWIHGTAAALASGSELASQQAGAASPAVSSVGSAVGSSVTVDGQTVRAHGRRKVRHIGQPILASDIAKYVPDAIGLALSL